MYKIFIVEDEELLRNGMKNNVKWEEEGYIFCGEARDGEEALPLIRNIIPDIVITDIKMPFMNGLELSRILKKEIPNIRIMVLTGYDEFEFAREALSIGADEYILKPFSSEKLIVALNGIAKKINEDKKNKIWNFEKYIVEKDFIKKIQNKKNVISKDFYKNDNEDIEEFFRLGNIEHIDDFVNEYIKRLDGALGYSYIYIYYNRQKFRLLLTDYSFHFRVFLDFL